MDAPKRRKMEMAQQSRKPATNLRDRFSKKITQSMKNKIKPTEQVPNHSGSISKLLKETSTENTLEASSLVRQMYVWQHTVDRLNVVWDSFLERNALPGCVSPNASTA